MTYLDSLRINLFDKFAGQLEAAGFTPEKHPKSFADMARFLNVATGRGELSQRTKQMGPFLNILYSPKLLKSRFQLMNPLFYANLAPGARKIAVKKAVEFYSAIPVALGLAAAAGASVDWDDIDSPDWLKIRLGNTRYEITGGMQPVARFIARLSRAVIKQSQGERHDDYLDIGKHFLRSKLAPLSSLAVDKYEGENFVGEPFKLVDTDPKSKVGPIPVKGAIPERLIPLYLQDMVDAIRDVGGIKGATKSIPGVLGIGATTYESKRKEDQTAAEKMARLIQTQTKIEREQLPGAEERNQLEAQLAGKMRANPEAAKQEIEAAIQAGKLNDKSRDDIKKRAKVSDLVDRVKKFNPRQAVEVWRKASDAEKQDLYEPIKKKLERAVDNPDYDATEIRILIEFVKNTRAASAGQ